MILATPPAPQQSPAVPAEDHKQKISLPHTPIALFKGGRSSNSKYEKSFFTETLIITPATTPSSSPMNTPLSTIDDDDRGVAEEKNPNDTVAAEDKPSVRAQLKELQKKLVNYELSEDGFLLEARKLVSNETKKSIIEEFKDGAVQYNRPVRSISLSGSLEEEKTMSGTNGMQETIKERLKALQYLLVTKQLQVSEFQNALRGLPLEEM